MLLPVYFSSALFGARLPFVVTKSVLFRISLGVPIDFICLRSQTRHAKGKFNNKLLDVERIV